MAHQSMFRSHSISQLRKHEEYYFEDGNLVIQVENILYKVFRSSLTRHSAVFKDVLSLSQHFDPELSSEGLSEENPFTLPGISSVDFDRLLAIIYPQMFGAYSLGSAEEWVSVLHLATRWEFNDIRMLVIKELQTLPMDPIDKIVLSAQYGITNSWALKAYAAICQRTRPISVEEARKLGVETAARIAQIRERLLRRVTPARRLSVDTRIPSPKPREPGCRTPSILSQKGRQATPKGNPKGFDDSIHMEMDFSKLEALVFGFQSKAAY